LPNWWVDGFESHKGATKQNKMTQKQIDITRKRLPRMSRKSLISTIFNLYKGELSTEDCENIAKATDSKIRIAIMSKLMLIEYLAK
jgi:hypothetical protein